MTKQKNLLGILSLLSIGLLVIIVGCSSKKKQVVAEVGNEKIYMDEYEKQYLKTVNNPDTAKNSNMEKRKEFLDLLIKFHLKVKDARDRGLLSSEDIQSDLKQYQENFLTSFLIDKEVVEPNIKNLYDMKEYEVRASHILVNLPQQGSTPEDSVKAYAKADEILKRLKNGDDFAVVAADMSDDQSAKQNGGDLYYFTAGMTVPEFEEAIYKMKVGDYSKEPIKTMFGLHIVKLADKRKRNEGIRASHILIQDKKDSTGKVIDSMATYNKAVEVLARIKKGDDFTVVAKEVSEDPGSKDKGGDLGFFDRRRMVQAFDSVAFLLKKDQVSDLVRTPYGWHIIKVTEIKPYLAFDKQKETLIADFKKGPVFKTEYAKFIEKTKKEYKFAIKEDGLQFMSSKIDPNNSVSTINMDSVFTPEDRTKVIATYEGGDVKLLDVINYLGKNREYAASLANRETLEKIINGAADLPILYKYALKKGVEKDPKYIEQLTEYEDGLLSFKVDQEELWRNIKITPEDLQGYYQSNLSLYSFTDSGKVKSKPFEEVKSEISNKLQQDKFKEMEKAYVDNLKSKYPIKINEVVLIEAFKD